MNTERPDHDDARGKGTSEERVTSEEERQEAAPEHGEAVTSSPAPAEETGESSPAPASDEEHAGPSASEDGQTEAPAQGHEDTEPPTQEREDAGSSAQEREDAEAPVAAPEHEDAGPPAREREPGGPFAHTYEHGGAHVAGREHDGPGGSRRRSGLVVASVAAAVLLVAGGGAYLAATTGGTSGAGAPSGDGTPPVLVLDGAPSGGGNGIAPGEPNPYGVTYRAAGPLPEGPASAAVRWARGTVGEDDVARLAEALRIDGTPVADGQVWRVGSGKDGSGPVLRVNRQAPGMWTFTRYAPGTDNCSPGTAVCTKDPASPAGDPVGTDAALKAAAPVLKAVGQDGAKVDASQVMGAQRVVNADPVVGGLPTYGWTTGITVGPRGEVVGGTGRLAEPVKGATYPLLGARETLDLLNAAPGTDHRMGIGGCAGPVPLKDRFESPCGASATAPQKETLTVEDAVLGLAPDTSGGRQLLVPSWLFEVRAKGARDTYTVTHPAIDPRYLAPASASASARPSTPPSSPGATGRAARDVRVEAYTADGTELTVRFTGGVCADYTARAVESRDKVTVTVTEKPWPDKVCILIAKVYHRTVRLDEPLAGRAVVGSDGKAVPLEKAGARLPDPAAQPR